MKRALMFILASFAVSGVTHANSWEYSSDEDAFTDTTNHYAVVRIPKSKALILVKCQNKELDTVVSVNEYIGNGHYAVRYRIDKK